MNKKLVSGTTRQAAAGKRAAKKTAPRAAAERSDAGEGAGRSTLFVNSVEKAMSVLKAFDASRPRLTLSQIAGLSDMDLSGAQRFTYTLLKLGYLVKDEETRTYSLSPQVFELSYHYLSSNELVNRAAPYVQQLSMHTGETANVTVLHGSDIVFVYRIASPQVLISGLNVGARMPAYCAAPGLAMLAHLPEEEVDAVLAGSNLVKHTPYTVVQPRAIKQRLAEIRSAGYAHTEEEYYLGDISTAAAVLDSRGRVMGAVNVAVAKPRWKGAEDERRIADMVISTALAISGR
jgi:IclR family transcriptional regulator, pca regulon regulatory protein